jgi:hypothetical protein
MVEHMKIAKYTRRMAVLFAGMDHGHRRNIADNQAEVEDEEDAPAPKATKAKADKSKAKPAAKAEAAPADDGE